MTSGSALDYKKWSLTNDLTQNINHSPITYIISVELTEILNAGSSPIVGWFIQFSECQWASTSKRFEYYTISCGKCDAQKEWVNSAELLLKIK